jgi:hypothetical protein
VSYQYPEIRKFDGLYLQANSFNVPDGALEIARNIEIQNDAIIQKTRGWYTYWTPGPGQELQALVTYDDTMLAFGSFGIMSFLNDTSLDPYSPIGIPTALTGEVFSLTYTTMTQEQNENLYFTTNGGIYKLESSGSKIRKAGVPPALELKGTAGTAATGPLPSDSNNGYRLLFGRRDSNGNLLLGAPSDVAYVSIPADGTGLAYTRSGGGPWTVTVDVPTSAGFSVGQQIIVSNGSDPDVNGTQTITAVGSSTTFAFSVAADPGAAGTLDISFSRDASFEASIPSEIDDITDAWFYQVYRSSASADLTVSPSPDFALVAETLLTAADLAAGWVIFTDDVDPLLVGAELYTNPNTREGELQANARPPKATDIQLYKGYMIYSNITTRQRLQLQMINSQDLTATILTFRIGSNVSTEENYVGISSGVVNQTVAATSVAGVTTVTITYNSHGASNGWEVELIDVTGSVPRGTYTISGVTANTFAITSTGNTATALTFAFVSNGTSAVYKVDTTSTSIAVRIANTSYYLVKAINRFSDYLYANYYSTFDDPPGRIRMESKFFESFPIYLKQSAAAQAFITPIPTSFSSGVQVKFDNDVLPNTIMVSKVSEPEAVPVLQFFPAGAKNQSNKRIFTLRDSLAILKEDGIYRLSGDIIDQFQITVIDETVHAISFMGADAINNVVQAITNQGIVAISESAVKIISRRMDDPIQFTLQSPTILDISCGFGYETARTFYFSIAAPILNRTPITYLYNVFNETWTDTERIFRNMCMGPDDSAFGIVGQEGNVIIRQRKSQTILDYSDEFATASATATGTKTATITLTGGPYDDVKLGDIVVYAGAISRIISVQTSGASWNVEFLHTTNIPNTPTDVVVYQAFTSTVKFAPFHAGQVGRDKFFAQMQFHLRQPAITNLQLTFATESYGSSENTDWEVQNITTDSEGWGLAPWGLFPWGQPDAIDLQVGTLPSVIVRTLVPLFAARSTWIQPRFDHTQAGEPMLIQALSWAVRGYGERVTK